MQADVQPSGSSQMCRRSGLGPWLLGPAALGCKVHTCCAALAIPRAQQAVNMRRARNVGMANPATGRRAGAAPAKRGPVGGADGGRRAG
jgi:hypothetical protein